MNMLVQTLERLGSDPWAWTAVAVAGVLAMVSFVRYRTCPHLNRRPGRAGRPRGDQAAALDYLNRRVAAGPCYFALIAAGVVAAVSGLTMIAWDSRPAIGFFVLLAGVLVLQTEPQRQRIRIASARVVAAQSTERRIVAREALRDGHRSLVLANLMIAIAVAAGLAAF